MFINQNFYLNKFQLQNSFLQVPSGKKIIRQPFNQSFYLGSALDRINFRLEETFIGGNNLFGMGLGNKKRLPSNKFEKDMHTERKLQNFSDLFEKS
jgi:hypothetical protein